jgi:hypothetical protein
MNLPLLALLWACDPTGQTITTTDTDASGGCPSGMIEASDAAMIITDLRVDSLRFIADFDPDGVYDGVPSACVNREGTEAQFTFTIGGDPAGTVTVGGDTPGSYDLVSDDDVSVSVSLSSAADGLSDAYGPASWTEGTAEVLADTSAVIVNVANARAIGPQSTMLQVTFSSNASVP